MAGPRSSKTDDARVAKRQDQVRGRTHIKATTREKDWGQVGLTSEAGGGKKDRPGRKTREGRKNLLPIIGLTPGLNGGGRGQLVSRQGPRSRKGSAE